MTKHELEICAGTIVWYDGDSSKALEGAHFISLHSPDYFELVSGDKVMAA